MALRPHLKIFKALFCCQVLVPISPLQDTRQCSQLPHTTRCHKEQSSRRTDMRIEHSCWLSQDHVGCQNGTDILIWGDFHVRYQPEHKALDTHALSPTLELKSLDIAPLLVLTCQWFTVVLPLLYNTPMWLAWWPPFAFSAAQGQVVTLPLCRLPGMGQTVLRGFISSEKFATVCFSTSWLFYALEILLLYHSYKCWITDGHSLQKWHCFSYSANRLSPIILTAGDAYMAKVRASWE